LELFKQIEGVKYFKWQRELGEKIGKEHMQFFIGFETAICRFWKNKTLCS